MYGILCCYRMKCEATGETINKCKKNNKTNNQSGRTDSVYAKIQLVSKYTQYFQRKNSFYKNEFFAN